MSIDIAQAAAALQLLPENGSRLLRLQRLAALGATSDLTGGKAISSTLLRRLLKREDVGGPDVLSQEDEYEDVLVDRILAFGQDFRVSSGLSERSVWIADRIIAGVLGPAGGALPHAFRQFVSDLSRLLLEVSNSVLASAGLEAGCEPGLGNREPVAVPGRQRLEELASGLIINEEAGENSLDRTIMERLVLGGNDESEPLFDEEWVSTALIESPMLTRGDKLVVANPLELMACLRIQVLAEADRCGLLPELGKALRREIESWLIRRAEDHGWRLQNVRNTDRDLRAARFTVPQTQSEVEVVIACDDLSTYSVAEPFGVLRGGILDRANNYLRTLTSVDGVNVTHIVIMEAYGRAMFQGVESGAPPRVLMLTGPDLDVLLAEERHPLGLERFADALDRLEEYSRVFSFSPVDTFATYRDNDDSFYFSDGPRPTMVSFTPGSGTKLRISRFYKRSERFAEYPEIGLRLMLRPKYQSVRVPVYVSQFGHHVVVGPSDVEVWVGTAPLSGLGATGNLLVEAVAYWTWSVLKLAKPSIDQVSSFTISVSFVDEITALAVASNRTDPFSFHLEFKGDLSSSLAEEGNDVDRQIVHALLSQLASQSDLYLPHVPHSRLVDSLAPFGNKTMLTEVRASSMLMWPTSVEPRFVEDSVIAKELDDLGEWVRTSEKYDVGEIAKSDRVTLLNKVVARYFSILASSVSELEGVNLLENLVAYNEALLTSSEIDQASLSARTLCWDGLIDVDDLSKSTLRAVGSAVASRFLIEYVVAQPPTGGAASLTIDRYERLLALCSEIVNRGMASDAINYGISDIDLRVLESGRLGVGRAGDQYFGAVQDLLKRNTTRTLGYAEGKISRHRSQAHEEWEPNEATEEALEGEFGFRFSELARAFGSLASIDWPPGDVDSTSRSLHFVREHLRINLGWSSDKVERFIDALSLRPRTAFVPNGRGPDVYPWRYNRELSYLRRPLLIRGSDPGNSEVVWGSRQLMASVGYWFNQIRGARIRAESTDLQRAVAVQRNELTEAFNDEVAELLDVSRTVQVRRRVKKIGKKRLLDDRNNDLGDVDVLVINPRSRTIWVLETKDFEVARTPAETANEVSKLIDGPKATIALHLKRSNWIKRNMSLVLEHFGEQVEKGWSVQAAVVLSEDLISADRANESEVMLVSVDAIYSLVTSDKAPKRRRVVGRRR